VQNRLLLITCRKLSCRRKACDAPSGWKFWCHSRPFEFTLLSMAYVSSYQYFIVTASLTFWDTCIQCWIIAYPWNTGLGHSGSLKMAPIDRSILYDFLLVFHCKYRVVLCDYRVIWQWTISWPWNLLKIRGDSKSLEIAPFNRLHTRSYVWRFPVIASSYK